MTNHTTHLKPTSKQTPAIASHHTPADKLGDFACETFGVCSDKGCNGEGQIELGDECIDLGRWF